MYYLNVIGQCLGVFCLASFMSLATVAWAVSSFTWDRWPGICLIFPLLVFDLALWSLFLDVVPNLRILLGSKIKDGVDEEVVPQDPCNRVETIISEGDGTCSEHIFPIDPLDKCEFTLSCEKCGFEKEVSLSHDYAYWYDTTANRYCRRCEEPGMH